MAFVFTSFKTTSGHAQTPPPQQAVAAEAETSAQDTLAQDTLTQEIPDQETDGTTYTPDFFTFFLPQTAQDMVNRIPGFTLQGGGSGGRGFGQANLNILINGQRPSSKSSDAGEILGRIPAESVLRIEVVNGNSLDIPGLTGQVANVITQTGKITGNWEYAARFEEGTEPQLLDGKMSVSGSRDDLDFVASFESRHFTFSETGEERFFNTDNVQFENRIEDIEYEQVNPTADLNLTWAPKPDQIVNLNLAFSGFYNSNFDAKERLTALTPEGRSGQTFFTTGENEINYEIGGDYSRPLGSGTLKLIGLHRYEKSDFKDVYIEFTDPTAPEAPSYASQFEREAIEGEYIGRSEYNWKRGEKQDWQVSLEGAFNVLDDTAGFKDNSTDFSLNTVRVEERRAEGFLTHNWTLKDGLILQSALGVEYSQLDVTTTADPARKFVRPKGSLALSYDLSPRYTFRSKIERDVGQLNFFDFVSSISLTENTLSGGNTKIVPTQFWNAEVELERKDDKVLSGTLTAALRYIEDPIDRIPLDGGGEGPGNLDTAIELSSHANATWLMDHIGLSGMQIDVSGGVHYMDIQDPVTGRKRPFNSETIWHVNGTLKHDIPNTPYAWSLYLEAFKQSKFLRLDQSFDQSFDAPVSNLTFIHKDLLGMKVSASLQNIFERKNNRTRQFFEGNRSGPALGYEFRTRNRGKRFSIIFEDTF